MKKFMAVLPAAASLLGIGIAQAEPVAKLYGVMDMGAQYQNTADGDSVKMVSGGLFATVFGIQGGEDLGNDLRVNFQLEQGFSGTDGSAISATSAFNRLAWVGLSGTYGELRVGRQKKPEYLFLNGLVDPVAAKSIASPMNNFNTFSVRSNNAITYILPDIHGLTGQVMVGLRDEKTSPDNGLQFYNVAARYVFGAYEFGAGYEQQDNATDTSTKTVVRLLGAYRHGPVRYYLSYNTESQSDRSEKRNIYGAAAGYAINPKNQLALMYGYAQDRTGQGNNAQQVGAIYQHFLSKSTILYGAVALIDNKNQAAYTANGTEYTGPDVEPGSFVRGIDLGITFKF